MDSTPRRRPPSSVDGFLNPIANRPKPIQYAYKARQPRHIERPTRPTHEVHPQPTRVSTSATPAPRPHAYSLSPGPGIDPPKHKLSRRAKRNKQPSKHPKRRMIIRSVLVVLALFLGVGGWLGIKGLNTINKVFHGNIISDAKALFSSTPLKGEDTGRVNLLLAGDSADDPGHGGADLTDSIMVVSIDTKNHTGFMLSIPRDLWVNIPGWSHQKINAANDETNFSQNGYPNGGMGQLEEILQDQLGIPIDYYALINYTAFKDTVNAVGGITVNIQSTDPRGLFDPNISYAEGGPLLLKNGVQTLNGQTALNLARARGDPTYDGRVEYGFPNSDYDRTQHQRQMLVALEQKASTVGVLANPIKVGQLFSALGNNVETDLSLSNVLRFVQVTKGMSISKLQSLTLSQSGTNALLTTYLTPNGQDALIPRAGIDDFSQVKQYYAQLASDNPVVKEAPSAVVLNASDVSGLARKEQTALQAKGFTVPSIADASTTYPGTMIIDTTNGQKPASKQALQQLFSGAAVSAAGTTGEAGEAQGYNADFIVVLGKNWDTTTTSTTN